MPITTMRPFVFSALRLAPRFGAPTSSRTTSNGPCSSKPSGSSTSSAPSCATASRASGLRTVAVTCAPTAWASWTAAVPTPPAAPWTSSRSPGRSRAWVKSASCAVVKTSGSPPAVGEPDGVGDRHELALVDDRELALAAAADDPHDPVALGEARRAGAEADDLARQLEPRDVRRRAGRRGIAPAQLHRSAPLRPAARTRTSTWPAPGSGSGCSSTRTSPSRIVAARIAAESNEVSRLTLHRVPTGGPQACVPHMDGNWGTPPLTVAHRQKRPQSARPSRPLTLGDAMRRRALYLRSFGMPTWPRQ